MLDEPKVLDDPLAVRIIGGAVGEIRAGIARHQSRVGRHFRTFLVARSRYAEDQLAASMARGVEQYVDVLEKLGISPGWTARLERDQ